MARRWKDPLIEREEREEREARRRERGGGDTDRNDRPSWRDRDRKKDQSPHSGGQAPGRNPLGPGANRGAASKKGYRAMLDRAFDSGNLGAVLGAGLKPLPGAEKTKARTDAARAVTDATDPAAVTAALKAYLDAGHELPKNNIDFLVATTEATDEAMLVASLKLLLELLETQKPRRSATLKQRLAYLAEQANDDELRRLADFARQRL